MSILTGIYNQNPPCTLKKPATNNDNMEGNTPIETSNTEYNASQSAADHQHIPEITKTDSSSSGNSQDFLANTCTNPLKEEKIRPKEVRNTIEILTLNVQGLRSNKN